MIWNFGSIYKLIRKSKGLSQVEVCSDELSRSTLSKIENNKLMPSFLTMDYLLRQINMTFDEFEYICNRYHPDYRTSLLEEISRTLSSHNTDMAKETIENCRKYLKINNDVYIQELSEIMEAKIKASSSNDIDDELKKIAEPIWKRLSNSNEWYFSDLILLNNILFYFSPKMLRKFTSMILQRLSKFDDYRQTIDIRCAIMINLSTIYLYDTDMNECYIILKQSLPFLEKTHRYDYLAIFWIRTGICKKDNALIEKGMSILKTVGNDKLLKQLKAEMDMFHVNTGD